MLDQRARPTDTVCADAASPAWANLRVAVLVPCFNEALTIERVVHGFAAALPGSSIYVYDNASTDATAASALRAGAIVRSEPWPGKGNVVRRMSADVEADVYLIVDGDGTYDDSSAPLLVQRLVDEHLDMVVGVRGDIYTEAHRRGHAVGNRIFNMAFAQLFGRGFTDIFSGYRALSRRFVKSFPALSRGFEIETEMAVHAMQLRLPWVEVETRYGARVEGSSSKLRTLRDALRILRMFVVLFKEVRPLAFFGAIGAVLAGTAALLAIPIFETYLITGLVPRLPTAVGITGLVVLAAIALTCGLILDSVARSRLEMKRVSYVAAASPCGRQRSATLP